MTYASIETSAAEGRPYFLYQFVEGEQVWRFTSQAEDWTSAGPGGSAVSRAAADIFKRVTLELGGKSPNLIFGDADLDKRVAEGACGRHPHQWARCGLQIALRRVQAFRQWPRRRCLWS